MKPITSYNKVVKDISIQERCIRNIVYETFEIMPRIRMGEKTGPFDADKYAQIFTEGLAAADKLVLLYKKKTSLEERHGGFLHEG